MSHLISSFSLPIQNFEYNLLKNPDFKRVWFTLKQTYSIIWNWTNVVFYYA